MLIKNKCQIKKRTFICKSTFKVCIHRFRDNDHEKTYDISSGH